MIETKMGDPKDEDLNLVEINVEELLLEIDWAVDIKVEDVEALHPLKQPSDTSQ